MRAVWRRSAEEDETTGDVRLHERLVIVRGNATVLAAHAIASEDGFSSEVTYGDEFFEGLRVARFTSVDGKVFRGEVDGKPVVPFLGTEAKSALHDDGSPVPTPIARDPALLAIAQDLVRSISEGAERCAASGDAEALGVSQEAVTSGGVEDPQNSTGCQVCRLACGTGAVALGGALAVACTPLLFFCPPCYAACLIGAAAGGTAWYASCTKGCDNNFCKPNFCGRDATGKEFFCEKGHLCLSKFTHRCCGEGQTPCGGAECCEPTKGEACVAGRCCAPPNKACGGECCPAGNCKLVDGKEVCCPGAVCADGTCCTLGSCVGGKCCPQGSACGDRCCGPSDSCIDGVCCPAGRACGSRCCGAGEKCANPLTGSCSECDSGQVACRDGATGGNVCCPSTAVGCCNGACCAPGTMCCGSPATCRADCIR